jgi:hypothetical protein
MKRVSTLHRGMLGLFLFLLSANATAAERIPVSAEGGVFTVPVEINGALTLDFVLDTGAAVVLVPIDVALTLMRTGTVAPADIRGVDQYQLADGSVIENMRVNFRALRIGTRTLYDVEGIVGDVESTLLLGQSALRQLEPWRLDTQAGELIVMDAATPDGDRAWRGSAPPQVASINPTAAPASRAGTSLRLSGWQADRNAAVVGDHSPRSPNGLGVNFPLDGEGARIVVCTGDPAIGGAAAIDLDITVDGRLLAGGRADASPRSDTCWNAYLPTSALYAIKNGSMLQVTIAGRIRYQVDLTGSAKAMNEAWAYVEARLPAAR